MNVEQKRRGYLIAALWGLVVAGLLAALALYLTIVLVVVVWGYFRDPGTLSGGFIWVVPFLFLAALMPFWGINVFWSVLELQPVHTAHRAAVRRSAVRLLRWTLAIYLGLVLVILGISWPEIGFEQVYVLAIFAGIGLFATLPLIFLLAGRSPIGRATDKTAERV